MRFRDTLSGAPSPSAAARVALRALLALGLLLILLPAAWGADTIIVPYASTGDRYQVVSWGAGAGFEQPAFDDSGFAPGGYEYFVLFALPPGFQSVRLDILWRADDQAALSVNDRRLPAPWGFFGASSPPGEFHGEIIPYLQPGMNRLQFLTSNAFVGINPTGVSFLATITLSP